MRRIILPLLAFAACAAVPSVAGLPPRLSFDSAALDDRALAGITGTGGGPALDDRMLAGIVVGSDGRSEDLSALLATQRDFDRSMIASSTSDPIDAWWAQIGSELIAANLL